MRWIATLVALVLVAGQSAAQTPAIMNLSCEKVSGPDNEPVAKSGVAVNLAQHTVTGFYPVAHIDRLDDVNVIFSGYTVTPFGGSSLVQGNVDRLTGATSIYTATYAKDGKLIAEQNHELACKVTGGF